MKTPKNKTSPFVATNKPYILPEDTLSTLNDAGVAYNSISANQKLTKIETIRKGLPFDSIEVISHRINRPVKAVLSLLDMPQTTYNKKKNENSRLDHRNSELIILISELIDYGTMVFNNEIEKFQRWLKKPNSSLGGLEPESLLDTVTGIQEVKYALHRLEYGNFA